MKRYLIVKNPLIVIFTAIALDAIGIGLIFPILPDLLGEVTHAANIASFIGITTAIYATMQFLFAPALGALSDRLGRRPVLLISLCGAAISYMFMAFSSTLWMLLIGRAVAGITSANMAVATAYITDVTPEDKRAARFGVSSAMFGVGFIIGPVLGGLLGDYWIRLPFIIAAAFNVCNMLLAYFVLPESHKPQKGKIGLAILNPLRPMKWIFSVKGLAPIILVFFIFGFSGEAYGTCWALWGTDAFKWNGVWIGLSLGTFGICQLLLQVFVTGPAVKLLGERTAIFISVACGCLALVVMAFAKQSWIIFAIMPVFALGGIGFPALQSLSTKQVKKSQQGQFQGVLAAVVSLSSIIAPLIFSSIYFLVQKQWPGAIWLSVSFVDMLIVLIVINLRLKKAEPDLINDLLI
jgi:DHA1 family tetracycline resistance protein-like MFS transporter